MDAIFFFTFLRIICLIYISPPYSLSVSDSSRDAWASSISTKNFLGCCSSQPEDRSFSFLTAIITGSFQSLGVFPLTEFHQVLVFQLPRPDAWQFSDGLFAHPCMFLPSTLCWQGQNLAVTHPSSLVEVSVQHSFLSETADEQILPADVFHLPKQKHTLFFFFHLKIQSNFCSMSSHSSSVMRRRSCSFASKSCLGWLNSESAFLPPQISALKHLTLTVQFQRGQLWSRSAEKGAWRCSRLSHWPAIPTSHIISNPGCTIFDPLFCECSRRASEDDFECLGPQYPCGKPGWGPRNLASNWPCSSHLGSEPTNGKYFLSHSFKHAYVCVYIWINMHIIYI